MINNFFMKTNIIYLPLLFIMATVAGCYTQKKATEQVNKANDKFPELVAKLARDKYPCTDLLKNDTAVIFKDTTIYVDCPDTARTDVFETVRVDTVNHTITKTIRVPVTLPVKTVYVNKWYEDSAKLKLHTLTITSLQKEIDRLQADNNTLAGKLKTRTKIMWLFVVIAVGMTIWNFRKLFV